MKSFAVAPVLLALATLHPAAQAPDGIARLLSEYVRIDTWNPLGDTRNAAGFLAGILDRDGIPVTRYQSEPGKAILYARLKATVSPAAGKAIVLMHHVDVVPAYKSRWKSEPFTPTIDGNILWAAARST
jgi:succinyl-diaminopimelate desuccinylase